MTDQYKIRQIPLEPTIDMIGPGENYRFSFLEMDQARQFVDLIDFFQDREKDMQRRLKEMVENEDANNEFLKNMLVLVEKIYYDDLDLERGTDIEELNDSISDLKSKLESWIED
jgi:hypothetical protein